MWQVLTSLFPFLPGALRFTLTPNEDSGGRHAHHLLSEPQKPLCVTRLIIMSWNRPPAVSSRARPAWEHRATHMFAIVTEHRNKSERWKRFDVVSGKTAFGSEHSHAPRLAGARPASWTPGEPRASDTVGRGRVPSAGSGLFRSESEVVRHEGCARGREPGSSAGHVRSPLAVALTGAYFLPQPHFSLFRHLADGLSACSFQEEQNFFFSRHRRRRQHHPSP